MEIGVVTRPEETVRFPENGTRLDRQATRARYLLLLLFLLVVRFRPSDTRPSNLSTLEHTENKTRCVIAAAAATRTRVTERGVSGGVLMARKTRAHTRTRTHTDKYICIL